MKALLQSLFGDAFARVLQGAGLSMLSMAAIMPIVLTGLNLAASNLSGITADLSSLALLSGAGEGMSIIGSAIVARVSMSSAGLGIGKATK